MGTETETQTEGETEQRDRGGDRDELRRDKTKESYLEKFNRWVLGVPTVHDIFACVETDHVRQCEWPHRVAL